MADQLCALWKELAEHPENPQVAAAVRARLVDLLDHVDDCGDCQRVSESMAAPELVFAALGDTSGEVSAEEIATLDEADRLFAESTTDIEAAITDVLLPGLPEHVVRPPGSAPMELFLASDAVNMLARSHLSRSRGIGGELSAAGLLVDDTRVATPQQLVAEIARHAKVSEQRAGDLWTWQLAACQACPALYRGLHGLPMPSGTVMLFVIESKPSAELGRRWAAFLRRPSLAERLKKLFPVPGNPLSGVIRIFDEVQPVVQVAAFELEASGDPELGRLLGQQCRELSLEREELFTLLDDIVVTAVPGRAAGRGHLKSAAVTLSPGDGVPVTFGRETLKTFEIKGPRGFGTIGLVKLARDVAVDRKAVYTHIVGFEPTGTIDLKPVKTFAARGIKRADREIAMLDEAVLKLDRS